MGIDKQMKDEVGVWKGLAIIKREGEKRWCEFKQVKRVVVMIPENSPYLDDIAKFVTYDDFDKNVKRQYNMKKSLEQSDMPIKQTQQ